MAAQHVRVSPGSWADAVRITVVQPVADCLRED